MFLYVLHILKGACIHVSMQPQQRNCMLRQLRTIDLAVSKQIAESQGRDSLNALFLVRTHVPRIYIDSNDRNFTRFKKGI